MCGETNYIIRISNEDISVISNFIQTLDDCPINLSNNDYVDIMRAIVDRSSDIDVDNIQLDYKEY